MVYLVLARKYRPQTFADLIGQGHVAVTIRNAITSKRIAHSYIFSGTRGCGKTSAARIFAKAVNCERIDTMNGEPCNECNSCKEITAGNSLDVIGIDGASNRGIEEVRSLRENVKYAPAKARHKIYIIDEVHMLTEPAFNALLKTLEEPPEHIIFIFATTEPHKLPNTILSRCQRYDFHRIPVLTIASHLKSILNKEQVTYEDEAIIEIAKSSNGSFRDSQTMLDQLIAFSSGKILTTDVRKILGLVEGELYERFMNSVIDDNKSDGLVILRTISDDGHDLVNFYNGLLEFLRNVMVLQVTDPTQASSMIDASEKDIEVMRKLSVKMEQSTVLALLDLLVESIKELKFSNTPLAYAEIIFMKMPDIHKGINIRNIYNQLQRIKQTGGTTDTGSPSIPQKPINMIQPISSQTAPTQNAQPPPPKTTSASEMFNKYPTSVQLPEGGEKKKDDSLTLETIMHRWKDFTSGFAGQKIRSLRGAALCCDFTAFENSILDITVTSKMAFDELTIPETEVFLKKSLTEFFGKPVQVHFTYKEMKPIAARTPIANSGENIDDQSSQIDYTPIIQSAVKLFGGDLLK